MTTQQQIDDLQDRVLALQRAKSRRVVRQQISTLASEVDTQIESIITSINNLRTLASEVSRRTTELAEELEEHING